jgi:hypothetical protein
VSEKQHFCGIIGLMASLVKFTVVNSLTTQELFTVTDQTSGNNLLSDFAIAPADPPVPLQANPDSSHSGRAVITFGYRGGVPTVNYQVSEGDQVPLQ